MADQSVFGVRGFRALPARLHMALLHFIEALPGRGPAP
jgi:hypothetical protein